MDKSGVGAGFLRELRFPLPIYMGYVGSGLVRKRDCGTDSRTNLEISEKRWKYRDKQ
jgi:hypothetical protein